MGEILQFVPKPKTESLEETAQRAISMFDKFKNNVSENFMNVPVNTLKEPRKDGWQTYLILHLVKIGFSSAEELTALSDDELCRVTTEESERIRLLQFALMRKFFHSSMLPSVVPKIEIIK